MLRQPEGLRELRRAGERTSKKRVERLMSEAGISGACKRPFRSKTTLAGAGPACPNLLAGAPPAGPGEVYVGDITYVATREGWLYLSVFIDLFTRRVEGWDLSESLATPLATAALRKASPPPGAICHTDRGCQYTSGEFRSLAGSLGLAQSMSGKGNCYDNAACESFFDSLKAECFPGTGVFESAAAARLAIFDYLEAFYNRARMPRLTHHYFKPSSRSR